MLSTHSPGTSSSFDDLNPRHTLPTPCAVHSKTTLNLGVSRRVVKPNQNALMSAIAKRGAFGQIVPDHLRASLCCLASAEQMEHGASISRQCLLAVSHLDNVGLVLPQYAMNSSTARYGLPDRAQTEISPPTLCLQSFVMLLHSLMMTVSLRNTPGTILEVCTRAAMMDSVVSSSCALASLATPPSNGRETEEDFHRTLRADDLFSDWLRGLGEDTVPVFYWFTVPCSKHVASWINRLVAVSYCQANVPP